MSSPRWSLRHLLTSSPPQHEAPPGQHDLLQDGTVHRAPLPELLQTTSSANELLSQIHYESGGNPRNTSPTGFESKEAATIPGRSLEDIYQLFDVQREFGEQEFGQIGTRSLLDHELAEMLPPVPDALRRVYGKHCGLWSRRWRVTKVAEFTTVCPKSFWETRCNGRSGKRGKCTNVSFIRRS